ncbi:MBL fold metallo-hydrolase [Planctomycetota bacterium]
MRQVASIFILILFMGIVLLVAGIVFMIPAKMGVENMNERIDANSVVSDVKITVVFDNNPYTEGLETAWGFSVLIEGPQETILFDTGANGAMLLNNMAKLEIDPKAIDIVVLSHKHQDHTGGLAGFLQANSEVKVYMLNSFPANLKEKVRSSGADLVEVTDQNEICSAVFTTGPLGRMIKEQTLVIRIDRGLIIITGCAHPGIVKMVTAARQMLQEDILFVMGGFHLEWAVAGKVGKIISSFKELGVQYVGPGHCTGEKARGLFKEQFGSSYIDIGVGRKITMTDLQ